MTFCDVFLANIHHLYSVVVPDLGGLTAKTLPKLPLTRLSCLFSSLTSCSSFLSRSLFSLHGALQRAGGVLRCLFADISVVVYGIKLKLSLSFWLKFLQPASRCFRTFTFRFLALLSRFFSVHPLPLAHLSLLTLVCFLVPVLLY